MGKNAAEVNTETMLVDINAIDVDSRPASQMRVRLDTEAVEQYAANLEQMPPVKLVFDEISNTYWVADGAHTIQACQILKKREISAIVRNGSFLDAWKMAATSNDAHGVRVTNADKRHRVEQAFKHPVMGKWKQQKIADWCGVTNQYVSKLDHRISNNGESNTLGNSGTPGGFGNPGRPASPKPDPPAETNGTAGSNGEAQRKPTAAEIATRVARENERAAQKWADHILKLLNVLSSMERAGGVKKLIEPWNRERRQQFAGQFQALVEQYQCIITQVEETLE